MHPSPTWRVLRLSWSQRLHRHWPLALLLASLAGPPAQAQARDPALPLLSPTLPLAQRAEAALQGLFAAFRSGQAPLVQAWLSPAFQLMRGDGALHDRASYLARSIPQVQGAVRFEDLRASQDGDMVIVSLRLHAQEQIEGRPLPGGAPQLVVFRVHPMAGAERWEILAAANMAPLPPLPSATNPRP